MIKKLPFLFPLLLLANNLPSQAPETPGLLNQRLQNDLKSSINKAVVEPIKIKEKDNEIKKTNLKVPSFILRGISLSGVSVFSKNELMKIIKPFIGKRVTSKDIKYISYLITRLYVKNGYVTSKCIIPPQKVKNGVIHLEVIENRIANVIFTGKKIYDYNTNFFMQYVSNIKGKILNINQLNNVLEVLSNLPASRIEPQIKKINDKYSVLIIKVITGDNHFSISLDNKGSKYTGIYRVHLNGTIKNIRGRSDILNILSTFTTHPKYLNSITLNYLTPYGNKGAKLNYMFSYMTYQLDPDQVGNNLAIYQGRSSDLVYLTQNQFLI